MSNVPSFPQRPLNKSYEPQGFEGDVYSVWEKQGCFEAQDGDTSRKAFTIMIPPPNVTGALHMGHALTNTIQDILTRWHRMRGENTLWMPGTDHAGIATQTQVEKWIRPKTRQDLGREKFLEKVWEWKNDYGSQITNQLRRLGSSLDWRRERFTMDEGFSRAVREAFVRLYEQGLVYRGERLINWSVAAQTALSDLEVVPAERKGHLWHLRYPVVEKDGKTVVDGNAPAYLVIATTRPETLLGDTAVAVHPEDERFKKFHGKCVKLPLVGKILPIILDDYVDREFGTGALKVTPAHDFNDYELGKKHGLPFVTVMGKDGKITAEGGAYAGLKFAAAREKVIEDLKSVDLLVKVEDHVHKVGLCQRTQTVAEPILSTQWFVKIAPLAKPAIEAVESGKVTFTPKTWEKTYFEWMYNIRDWCISRQLWWGHRIPAWYCEQCSEMTVAREPPAKCPKCASSRLTQDEDVLDTWFSSGLWPFATLGWPDRTPALATFYPNSVLETGFDIIFFWVARMMMMGIHFMGEPPFEKIYLHAMVRDEKGEKMSKTRGNVIDPLSVINEHGADPLRFTLAIMAGQGRDVKLSLDRVEGYRAFCNKLWNAVKFFHFQVDSSKGISWPQEGTQAWIHAHRTELTIENRWILSSLQKLARKVSMGLEQFELNVSAQSLYDFTWGELCDWYIELSKLSFREGGEGARQSLIVLHHVLDRLLKLLHPFIPFVTEELWQSLPLKTKDARTGLTTLMMQSFPQAVEEWIDEGAEEKVRQLQTIVDSIRNFRGENNLSPKIELPTRYSANVRSAALLKQLEPQVRSLSRITHLSESGGSAAPTESVIPLPELGIELFIDLKGLVNVEEETKRLKKEIAKVQDDLEHVQRKLNKPEFVQKAPPQLIEKERANALAYEAKLKDLRAGLDKLQMR